MRLIDGALAIRGDLPVSSTLSVEVPSGAGSSYGSAVHRLSSLQFVRDEMRATLHDTVTPVISIGGDCGVALASVEHAQTSGDVVVVWLDAHPDLNTPESSASGAFTGMVLRTLLGDGPQELVPDRPLSPARVILAGTRALDSAEIAFVESADIRMLPPGGLTPDTLTAAIVATGASSVYLHIDLDVLDPAEFAGVGSPEPFGLTLQGLLDLITAARAALPLVGASITEFAPSSPDAASDDLPSVLRIVGALTKKT